MIADKEVPIETGALAIVYFRQDPGNVNPGRWEFWTVVGVSASVTGRCRPGSDPGERFRRMEGQEDYADAWEIAASATVVRPANEEKILGWLNSHEVDAAFAESCSIGSTARRVVRTAEGFSLE